MKLIGVRFSRYNLTFSRSFLYVLILNYLFKNVKKFANFLDNFLKGGEEMRPRRYPYSGKKESTFVKADPELVEKILRNTSYLECLQKKPINFQIDLLERISRLESQVISLANHEMFKIPSSRSSTA
ncbi:Phage protein [Streptococcus pneumoniae]|nr:Phage protein [Streptococcus pneumoniae]VOT32055.1 Phage protein [Streptococcus pneumoniae]VQG46372.1 Phage protein [Streptococcus pneumoniae]VQJ52162.1 Phage protein [Streptococcus pneumoniae]VSX39530.1 Phage protein [Streptococcus pneumoniae]